LNCNGDNDWPKACEIKIDDKNCGTCGNDCTKENKVCNGRTCVDKSSSSSSSQLKCSVGWGSCNNKNKCDTNLVSNDHCGDCTTKCDTTNGKEYCEMSNTKEIKCVARTTEKCFQPLASANDPVIASVDSDKSEDLKVDQVTVFPTTQIENANVIISESSQPEGSESPGLVYKYLSIEVSFGVESKVESSSDSGTSSSLSAAIVPITPLYAYKEISTDTPTDKISNIEINFKVEKSWLIDNNREWSDVVLNHYENGEWIKLKTTTLTEDATYYYFSADSTSASPFAITVGENKDTCPYECCMNEAEYTDKLCDTGYICEDNICTEIVTSTETAVQQPMNFTTLITIVGGIAVIALVIIYFILKKKQKPAKSMEELRAKYRKR
jgi:hypothetical protein